MAVVVGWLGEFARDCQYAGIGATTAIFSVVNGVVLRSGTRDDRVG